MHLGVIKQQVACARPSQKESVPFCELMFQPNSRVSG